VPQEKETFFHMQTDGSDRYEALFPLYWYMQNATHLPNGSKEMDPLNSGCCQFTCAKRVPSLVARGIVI